MKRRQFISLLGGAAAAWPIGARAQQTVPVVGLLSGQSFAGFGHFLRAFHQGLNETGYVEGRNVAIEYRWAEGQFDRLPALAVDLVGRRVAAIAATAGGGTSAALAAKAATTTIPIVFTTADDPVKLGLVASLNRPGGNITGIAWLSYALEAKRLGLLHELIPKVAAVTVLVNPTNTAVETQLRDLREAAHTLGLKLKIVNVIAESDLDAAFTAAAEQQPSVLLVTASALFNTHRGRLVALAARHSIPAIYEHRDYVAEGGLVSYGANNADAVRQVGVYIGRILKGEKPADLPVMQPTRFEFVINLKSARALGVDVPAKLLALADEVIE
jgi:putative ABC transport system substrate-binding protein